MKLKNNDPVKIWSKSDHWFKSYDQKVYLSRNRGTGTGPGNWGFQNPVNQEPSYWSGSKTVLKCLF